MAGSPVEVLYPIALSLDVDTSSTTAVTVWPIPAGTIITAVLAKMKVAGTGSGNLIVGDDDDDDGFILAADATGAAKVVYGDTPEERGAYLYMGDSYHSTKMKFYTSSGKSVIMDCSAALTTEATVTVIILGYRFYV